MTARTADPRGRDSATQHGDSYYGRPILKEPVWTWEIPVYFFVGGLAGALSPLALAARRTGRETLARRLRLLDFVSITLAPALLISDLGRPERFLNMLRVFKVTSPMSVGTWVVTLEGGATGVGSTLELVGRLPRVRHAAEWISALLGPPTATYTAGLVSDTAIPVWHEARRELPFVFAASSAASAGAAGAILAPTVESGPARRLAVLGGAAELVASQLMERRLGSFLAEPYHQGEAGRWEGAAKGCTVAGTALMALAGRRRAGAVAAGGLLLAGSFAKRFAVFRAGFAGARDPRYVVEPQRRRALEARA